MIKKHFAALEKVFGAEIAGSLPFQSKAKVYDEMQQLGFVQPMVRYFGNPPFRVTVSGWALTDLGRLEYCSNCGVDR